MWKPFVSAVCRLSKFRKDKPVQPNGPWLVGYEGMPLRKQNPLDNASVVDENETGRWVVRQETILRILSFPKSSALAWLS